MRLLLVVEQATEASRVGVVVAPALEHGEAQRWTRFDVELRLPTGARERALALATRWPGRPGVSLTILDRTKDDVPKGTEVWAVA